MFDPCVRGASDVFKAVALCAKFVFISRLWVWGLSIMVSGSIIVIASVFQHVNESCRVNTACVM